MPARTFPVAPSLAGVYMRPRQFTCAYLGDSLTQGSHAAWNAGDAYPDYVGPASQGRIVNAGNYGVSGQRSDQIAGRVQSALLGRPNYLAVLAGTNDIGQGISTGLSDAQIIEQIKQNLRLIYRSADAVGTVPVAITIPPNNDSSNANRRQLLTAKMNIWIRRHAFLKGYPLVDFYTLLAKDGISATPPGAYKTAYALDGTHPNAAGCNALGALFASTLTGSSPAMPFTATDTLDTTRQFLLFNNPLFATSANDPKIPDSWSAYGAPTSDTNTVYSMTTDSQIPGKVCQIALNSSATNFGGLTATAGSGNVAAGDLIAISGWYTTDGVANTQVQLQLAGMTYKPVGSGSANQAVTRGFYYLEATMPGTGAVAVSLVPGKVTGSASTQLFGFPTVVNLTRAINESTPVAVS